MRQLTIATSSLFSDPDSVIRQIKKLLLGRTTGVFQVTAETETCSGCERDDRREWTEPGDHTCAKKEYKRAI